MLTANQTKRQSFVKELRLPTETAERAGDFLRATQLTPEIEAAIDDSFEYHEWNDAQAGAGREIRRALAEAVKLMIMLVPPCPDRSSAIRKLREARMDANSAITHNGKY